MKNIRLLRDRFDLPLLVATSLLLGIGVLLVYAATRDWYASAGEDPQFYLKRQILNIIIGLLLAAGAMSIDYRLLRAYTPILWGLSVIGLIAVLIPAFAISEIKTGFLIGFVIYLPFLAIDFAVASILTSLGMVMVSPMMFSLPLKLIVFALADGWTLLSLSLVQSYFN